MLPKSVAGHGEVWMDVPLLCTAWLIMTPRLHQLLEKTGWWLGLCRSEPRCSGETQKVRENTLASSIAWCRIVERLSIHHKCSFHGNSSISHLQQMKCALGKKTNASTLPDAGTENQGAFLLDCLPCHAEEVWDPRDHCELVMPHHKPAIDTKPMSAG